MWIPINLTKLCHCSLRSVWISSTKSIAWEQADFGVAFILFSGEKKKIQSNYEYITNTVCRQKLRALQNQLRPKIKIAVVPLTLPTRLPISEVGSRRAWLYRKLGIGLNGLAPRPRPRHMPSRCMLETAGTRFRYNQVQCFTCRQMGVGKSFCFSSIYGPI
jgi:hypothetical protein